MKQNILTIALFMESIILSIFTLVFTVEFALLREAAGGSDVVVFGAFFASFFVLRFVMIGINQFVIKKLIQRKNKKDSFLFFVLGCWVDDFTLLKEGENLPVRSFILNTDIVASVSVVILFMLGLFPSW